MEWPLAPALVAPVWNAVYLVPHVHGHLQNLGELAGALAVRWRVLLLSSHPLLGGVLLGAAAVGCKLLYLPAVVALVAAEPAPALDAGSRSRYRAATRLLGLGACFAYVTAKSRAAQW